MNRPAFTFGVVTAIFLIMGGRAGALPLESGYPGLKSALPAPSEQEKELLAAIQQDRTRSGREPLRWDGLMSAVAREHSQDMADNDYFDYPSPRLGAIEYRLHRSGVSAANARYVIFRAGSVEVTRQQFMESGLHHENATDIGIGVVSEGRFQKTYFTTIILTERHTELERFPTQPLAGKGYRLAGRMDAGYEQAEVIVTRPDGSVDQQPLPLNPERRFDTIVRFHEGPGKYSVEITAQGALGSTVLDLMHCYAGVPYPEPSLPAGEKTPEDPRQAEIMMLRILNATRAANRLAPLEMDERVSRVARAHSADMLSNGFFAHVSPTQGTLQDRLERAAIKARKFTENLSSNRSLTAAHDGLMDSPGHRKNILDPEVTRVGIGIARSGDGQLLITENFIQPFTDYDTADLAARLLDAINAARRERQLSEVARSPALDRIARANSEYMRDHAQIGYQEATRLLERERPGLKYIQMSVLESTDPPVPDQVSDALNGRYGVVGIGVVQGNTPAGEKPLYTTVLLGEK